MPWAIKYKPCKDAEVYQIEDEAGFWVIINGLGGDIQAYCPCSKQVEEFAQCGTGEVYESVIREREKKLSQTKINMDLLSIHVFNQSMEKDLTDWKTIDYAKAISK